MCCCVEDEGLWPFGVAPAGAASNHPHAALAEVNSPGESGDPTLIETHRHGHAQLNPRGVTLALPGRK